MSQPVLSGEQLQVAVENNVLRITNDPGFWSDNGDGCPYRAVYLKGPVSYGRNFETTSPTTSPTDIWPGFFKTRSDLAGWRQALIPGDYFLRVFGGTYFKGWGDHPDDAIEWGYTDHISRFNEVTFTVALVPPPVVTPVPNETLASNETEAVGVLYRLVEQWRRNEVSEESIVNSLHYQVIKALSETDKSKRVALKNAIRSVLG